jgi:hypothetical protein
LLPGGINKHCARSTIWAPMQPFPSLPATELSEAFLWEAGKSGFQIVIDCVWGAHAEAFLAAIAQRESGYPI